MVYKCPFSNNVHDLGSDLSKLALEIEETEEEEDAFECI